MKSAIYFTILFLLVAPSQGVGPDCCFIDLFCSSRCVSLFVNERPWPQVRGARSLFHGIGSEGQLDRGFPNGVGRNIHAGRMFAPSHHISKRKAGSGSQKLGLLNRLGGSR